jgi:anti-sigma regulatory factor (Ser/Thr protein kinase)
MTSTPNPITDPSQVAAARRAVEHAAAMLAFDATSAGRAALVVTELATNILRHAQRGEVLITPCRTGEKRGLEVLAIDGGRGIPNLPAAMEDGHSTAGSLGHGLGAVRRQADQFDAFSQPGKGTAILARIWDRPTGVPARNGFTIGAVSVSKPGEQTCGDGWSAAIGPHNAAVIVADGLGHGILAAEASTTAIDVFARAPLRSPAATVEEVHLALRATRGAAVAVAAIELERDVVSYSGLGNISAAIISAEVRRNLISHAGTAGHSARKVQELTYPLPLPSTIVIHSDGLGTHWSPADYPELWSHDPALIAGILYRDFSRKRDDVTVVVGRRSR